MIVHAHMHVSALICIYESRVGICNMLNCLEGGDLPPLALLTSALLSCSLADLACLHFPALSTEAFL